MSVKDLLFIISNPTTEMQTLAEALKKLGEVSEPPTFWSGIANNDAFTRDHRRMIVFQLFIRHIKNGITLKALAEILDRPSWLRLENISIVKEIAGKIPVTFDFNDTILVIDALPEVPGDQDSNWTIYLRIEGKINKEDFYKIICGTETENLVAIKERKIIECGISPDRNHIYDQKNFVK
jgi:hypothetical protein